MTGYSDFEEDGKVDGTNQERQATTDGKNDRNSLKTTAPSIPKEKSFLTTIHEAAFGSNAKYSTSNDGKLDEIIPNFVSNHVRRFCYSALAKQLDQPFSQKKLAMPTLEPCINEAFGAVVMVDVSGYSKLTATLAERGAVGAELLAKTMKSYFDQVHF